MSDWAVIFERAGDGSWSAYAPDLPVVACGATRTEVEAQMREALQLYREELERTGEAPPAPRSEVGVIAT